MRLINAQSLRLEEHFDSNAPPYAILSHTWEDGEVSFQDTALPASAKTRSKPGYKKIEETCRLACEHGLELSWVDTCCIDKSSSAELTESINSMFRWYQDASICFVYLSDLEPTVSIQDGMKRCRWFRRGWTLQELLAPRNIQFYDRDWKFRGTKDNFVDIIKATTRIPKSILQGQTSIRDYSVASKMAWAAKRKTTRIEDTAYCLMGIFGVNMALIYGEGPRAFKRLQEEIVKNSNDLTIFSWDEADRTLAHQNLFATSPAAFAGRGGTKPYDRSELNPEFAITNKGLRIESRLQTMAPPSFG
ncbi:heterokaryon incompatibility protein-domain-containing protein [Lasiosphaeris hirsuta]|uniref:Heterokaryon incompatibility protein-domain-containing protein n=1 Tax=Lasiosphaeris hirsuta TaxID=260670 RepID=A0AA40A1W4_9PEZI|nr:heterokaryon incompatibility protein-domain-containing protein [Lasiosphaeris hirsuta]